MSSSMRTPLARVRGLGSAREGAEHFWMQRVTAVANLVLVIFLLGLIVSLLGQDYASARAAIGQPLIAIPLLLLIISGAYHMRLGMQVVVEDYVRAEGTKLILLMLNTFFAIAIAVASIFSILKLSFGA
ncbi:MAG: succinate dehydrogenase, hydrophobic membrane anchor protein [Pseudomonadota bacterium]